MTSACWFAWLAVATSFASAGKSGDHASPAQGSPQAGIEQLHRRDILATLAVDVEQLSDSFTDDGVLLAQGAPAVVGRKAIWAFMEKQKAQSDAAGMKVVKYAPQIRDLSIQGEWAFEWGEFEAVQQARDGKTIEFHGKLLRVLKRQADGSWKFARVMWNADGS